MKSLAHDTILRCAVAAMLLCLTGCGPITFVVGVSSGGQELRTTVVEPAKGWFSPRVVIIDVSGPIYNANKRGLLNQGENPVSVLHERLEKAKHDPAVKAVILRLNTPGGTVTASDAMYRMVGRFKQDTGKPVVALMMDVTASGGYYLACAADRIVAYPTAITGSVGVIVQTISFKSALSRIGIHAEAITTGPNKDAGSPLSDMTDEHRAVLRSLVDDFYGRFVAVVRQARPSIPADLIKQATDGRVLSGTQAVQWGMADQAGDLYDAFALAKELAGVSDAELVIYHRPLDYVGSPYASARSWPGPGAASGGLQINLAQFNLPDPLASLPMEFYYLWQPELE